MRIVQFGDLHLDQSTSENVSHAMRQIREIVEAERPDLVVNTGDLAMRRGHLAPWVAEALREWHCALAEVAPVVVVAGNHDMVFDWEKAGTLRGALSSSRENDRIFLAERPCVFVPETASGPIRVACLPYPSRYALTAGNGHVPAGEVNERLSAGLADVARGLAIEAEQLGGELPPILVYHGSICGATTGTEQTMSTEIDPVLHEHEIPEAFAAVLCGHIHKPQAIGRAVYAGSPAPLNFGEENHEHGVQIWSLAPEGYWSARFIPLEPAHRLLTIDLRGESDPVAAFQARELGRVHGARLRLLVRLPRGVVIEPIAARLEGLATERGAFDCRLQVERDQEDRSAALETRAEAALDTLLKDYVERNPPPNPTLGAALYSGDRLRMLQALGAEIDGELPPEVRAIERTADYRLVALRWSNWKSFAEEAGSIDVSDLGRLVCIEGENASGKSNLTEIEAFALWGRLPRGKQPLGQLVRIGAREAWVEVDFHASGQTYRARRSITVNARGEGKGLLTLQRGITFDRPWGAPLEKGWEPANLGDARETQAFIEQLVGTFDLYLATRFASQGDIDRLLSMTGADLKDTIQGALGTGIFEHRERAAKARAARHETEAGKLTAQAEALEAQGKTAAALRECLGEHEAALAGATEQKTAAKRAQVDASEALEAARAKLAEERERAQKRQAVEDAIDEADRVICGIDEMRTPYDVMVADGEKAAKDLVEHRARVEELATLAGIEARAMERAARIRDLRKQVDEARRRKDAEADRWGKAVASAEVTRKQAGDHLGRERQTANMIGTAPFGEKCAEAKCGMLRLPIEARARIPGLQQRLEEAERAFDKAGEDMKAAATEAHLVVDDLQKQLDELTSQPIGDAQARATELRAAVNSFDQAGAVVRISRGDRARGERESEGRLRASTVERLELLRAQLAALPAADVDAARENEMQARTALAYRSNEFDALERQERAAAEKVANLKGRIEAGEEAAGKAVEVRSAADRELASSWLASVFARAMGRDGVPYLMLERALPALEAHANAFLASDDLRLEIEPARDLRTGEQRSEVYVRFRDGFGLHELAAASGYQRVVLGYALRAALAQIQAEAHGLTVSHFVADEGWSAASENNLLACQGMLRRMGERFGRVLFVSHQSEIREVADTRLRVVPDRKHGSRLEVAA